ncbi:MAG: repeat containing protein [Cyanobacteria bacterium RYN_339]|nr:repeat containing protein [Cyanobacteria bacterium RYN_339]
MKPFAYLLAAALLMSAAPAWACTSDDLTTADIEEQIQAGYFLDRQGEYQLAIDKFQGIIKAHPDNRKAHYFLANTYWRDNNFIESSKQWATVLRMEPTDRIGREAREWLDANGKYIKTGAVVQTVTGGQPGFADGTMSTARFRSPSGMVLSPTGNLYIADTGNHRIRRITPDGRVLTVAGNGTAGYADGQARTALLDAPHGLALDPVGNLYFCDGPRVRFVTPDGKVGTAAGGADRAFIDGTYDRARFRNPRAISCDDKGNVFVADDGTALRVIQPNGEVHLLAGSARADFTDGQGEGARFKNITALKWTKDRVLVVVDAGANRLRAVDMLGRVKSLPGCMQVGYVDGPIGSAHFSKVGGLAVDQRGNVLLADTGNFAIRRVNDKLEVETLAGGAGAGAQDGLGVNAHFREPSDIAVWNNTVFVLDRQLHGVRRITLSAKEL